MSTRNKHGNRIDNFFYTFAGDTLHYIAQHEPLAYKTITTAHQKFQIHIKELAFAIGYSDPIFTDALYAILTGDPIWTNKKQIRVGLRMANGQKRVEVLASQFRSKNNEDTYPTENHSCTDILIGAPTATFSTIIAGPHSPHYPAQLKKLPVLKAAIIIRWNEYMFDTLKLLGNYPHEPLDIYQQLVNTLYNNLIFYNKLGPIDNPIMTPAQKAASWWRRIDMLRLLGVRVHKTGTLDDLHPDH